MAKMPQTYDPKNHDPQDDVFEPIPPGVYTIEVSDSEIKESKAGDPYLSFELTVLGDAEGKYAGRKIWESLNLWNSKSAVAVEIAEGKFSAMCRALGYTDDVEDTEVLHGRTCEARVKIETSTYKGEERRSNRIAAYKFKRGEAAPSSSPAAAKPWEKKGGAQPPASAPEAVASVPEGAQAAESAEAPPSEGEGTSKPPWLR